MLVGMHISALFVSIFLLSVHAAPSLVARVPSPETHPLVARLVDIDQHSCKDHLQKVETAFSDAFTLASDAVQGLSQDAHDAIFFPQDTALVVNMYKSILSGGGEHGKKKIPVTCKDISACTTNNHGNPPLAATTFKNRPNPNLNLCPLFFTHSWTEQDLSSKQFTPNGWCKGYPNFNIAQSLTAGHVVLHEMTHLAFIAMHAAKEAGHRYAHHPILVDSTGTDDLLGKKDENHGSKTYSQFPPAGVITLKQRWEAYLAQKKPGGSLKKPPLVMTMVAEAYAVTATLSYLSVNCHKALHG
ncbi:hypothetical protein BDP27DRAFT_1319676 [Rhodocollybia butyracea]|uniref:Lysine-specific metallo-endopeptidase domain-containing protein n=1 Tax=Rhodocollybia butyracea TaxID=206335 RepID=A0A9P5Q2K3_9AGAR|nr:hypothetical protein BDP27DRAFT_1319676 [Rhodocollybia butyracea]